MKLLEGEELINSTRPHGRVLIWPAIALICLGGLTGAGLALVPPQWRPEGQYALAGLALLTGWFMVVRPVLRWASTRTTLTTRRLLTRSGLFARVRHEVPLDRISDVAFSRRAGDLGFGSGTLLLTMASGKRLRMDNLPQVKAMAEAVGELSLEASMALDLDAGQHRAG